MSTRGRPAALKLLVGHLALSPLIFSALLLEAYEYPKVLLLQAVALVLLAMVAGAWAGWLGWPAARRDRATGGSWLETLRDPLTWGVLAFLASAAASSVASVSPRTSLLGTHGSWAGLATLSAYAVLFFATRALVADERSARALLWAPVVAATAAAIHGLLQSVGADAIPTPIAGHPTALARGAGPLGNSTFLGGYLAMVIPVTAHLTLCAWEKRRRAVALALTLAVLLQAIGLLITFSRGPWAGFGLAALVLAGGWWWVGERRRTRWLIGLGALCGLALAALTIATGTLEPAFERASSRLMRLAEPGREVRLHIWDATWRVFLDRPLLGVGPDALALVFPRHASPELWAMEPGTTATRAHNQILHVAATQGLAGLAALGVLLAGGVAVARRALQRDRPRSERTLAVALAAGIAAYCGYALSGLTMAPIGVLVATYAGLLSALGRPHPERADAKRSAPPLTAGALGGLLAACSLIAAVLYVGSSRPGDWYAPGSLYLATLLAGTVVAWRTEQQGAGDDDDASSNAGLGGPRDRPPLRVRLAWAALWPICGLILLHAVLFPLGSSSLARRGDRLIEIGEPREAIRSLEQAVARDPRSFVFWRLLASAHWQVAARESDPQRKRIEFESARDGLRQALALEPEDLFTQASLARTMTELATLEPPAADTQEVLAFFDEILARAPGQLGFRRDAARAALALGEPARAEAYARQNLELLPDFAPSRAQLGLAAVMRAEWEEAIRQLEEAAPQRWFGDLAAEAEAWAALARARLELGQPREALEAAERALELDPNLPEARLHQQRALELLAPAETGADRAAPAASRARSASQRDMMSAMFRARRRRALAPGDCAGGIFASHGEPFRMLDSICAGSPQVGG